MKLLLPVDGSDVSLEAVRFAIRLARSGLETSVPIRSSGLSAGCRVTATSMVSPSGSE